MTPRTTAARRSHAASPTRTRSASPAIPRRVSGPVARPVAARVAPVPAPAPARARTRGTASAARPLQRVLALPDHPLVDRLLRGRVWIWMIGICLGGIVAMQVSLLKLNTGISRAVQTSATLERQNTTLAGGIAQLSSQERVRRAAATLGMDSPQAGDVEYVEVRGPLDGRRASNRMTEPSEHARAALAAATSTASLATATTGAETTGATADPNAATAAAPVAPVAATTAPATTSAPVAQVPASAPATAAAPQG